MFAFNLTQLSFLCVYLIGFSCCAHLVFIVINFRKSLASRNPNPTPRERYRKCHVFCIVRMHVYQPTLPLHTLPDAFHLLLLHFSECYAGLIYSYMQPFTLLERIDECFRTSLTSSDSLLHHYIHVKFKYKEFRGFSLSLFLYLCILQLHCAKHGADF